MNRNFNFNAVFYTYLLFSLFMSLIFCSCQKDINKLIMELKDNDPVIRQNAAFELGELKDSSAVESLITSLHDGYISVQENAMHALIKIGKSAVIPLITVAKLDNIDFYKRIIYVLGEIKDPRAIDFLIIAFKDNDESVQAISVDVIGKMGTLAFIPLVTALKDDNDTIRQNAAKALGNLNDPRVIEHLINTMKDNNFDVSYNSMDALKKIGASALYPLINALKDKDNDPLLRQNAAEVLGKLKDTSVVENLLTELKDDNLKVRKGVIEALGELKSQKVLEPLIILLKNNELRENAADALGKLKDPRAVEPLIAALKYEDYYYARSNVANALGEIRDPRAIEPLINILKDNESPVQHSATDALIKIGEPAVIPLTKALKNKNSNIRGFAVLALFTINTELANKELNEISKKIDLTLITQQYESVIREGKQINEIPLIFVLFKNENGSMAQDFLNCGNSLLEKAAKMWLQKHNYLIYYSLGKTKSNLIWREIK